MIEMPIAVMSGARRGAPRRGHDRERRQPMTGERADRRVGDHGAQHHHFAMGEVDELDDAVHHGVAERDHGVNRAEREAVDQLLDEYVHEQKRHPQVPSSRLPVKGAYFFPASPAAGAAACAMKSSYAMVLPLLMMAIGRSCPAFMVKMVISASLRSPLSSKAMRPVAPA